MAEKRIWSGTRKSLYLEYESSTQERLEKVIYKANVDAFGRPFLEFSEEKYSFNYKLYGIEEELIKRIEKTYFNTRGNLGVLFNGLKGTGKSVTAKQVCNRMNLPVILLTSAELIGWVNEIPEDVVIFIDEYEKIFRERDTILTMMDGALESIHRRIFLLTTNTLSINENLLHRPGRIRYLKTFKDLSPQIVNEIVTDCLKDLSMREQVVNFCATLEHITIDAVKSVCEECNIHDELPAVFENVFNLKKITGKYDVFIIHEKEKIKVFESIRLWPTPFDEDHIGCNLNLAEYYCKIYEIIDDRVAKVHVKLEEGEHDPFIQAVVSAGFSAEEFECKPTASLIEKKSRRRNLEKPISLSTASKKAEHLLNELNKLEREEKTYEFTVRVSPSNMMNNIYKYFF
jgi:SpoVK/Ycf46/Vps4 family AAA+-type ATPase